MQQDYSKLTLDELEQIEKQTMRVIVQAVQEYSREAKIIFENTQAPSENEVIVLAEDLVQYALEVAECYPINKRFAGFIDYKRVRWIPTPFGLFPQALLVDAKASTENNRETLQQSQLPMAADFITNGEPVHLDAGIPSHLEVASSDGTHLHAVTTSAFVHYHYQKLKSTTQPFRILKSIYLLLVPHQLLKPRYNPGPDHTFFGQGKHSPARGEVPRIRIYYNRFRAMCPWRLQELKYESNDGYTTPSWRDFSYEKKEEVIMPFKYIGR